MKRVLRIDSSSRLMGSRKRELGDYLEGRLASIRPQVRAIRRDLARRPPEQIRPETIAGFCTAAETVTADPRSAAELSESLIGGLQFADALLITAPNNNFGVPVAMTARIDPIVRIGHTFSNDGTSFGGLAKPKQAIICAAYGATGYQAGQPFRATKILEPYLKVLRSFLGNPAVHFITVQATTADAATVEAGTREARATIDRLLANITNGVEGQRS